MKKVIVLLVLIVSVRVYADCDKKELARLKKIAENVEINYITDIKEKKKNDKELYKYGEYTLNATNINSDIKVRVYQDYYANIYKEFKVDNGVGILGPFYDGEKVTVTIEAYVKNDCSGEKLRTINVKMPYYNVYSEDMACAETGLYHKTNCCIVMREEKFNNVDQFNKCISDEINKLLSGIEEPVGEPEEKKLNIPFIISIITSILLVILICVVIIKKRKKSQI